MAKTTSSDAEPEQPEATPEELRAANRKGYWILLALVAFCVVIAAAKGLKGIFAGQWR